MKIYAMTGGSNGMGAAAKKMIEDRGDKVINVDIEGTDIIADLGTKEGRSKAIDEIRKAAPEGLDGFMAVAGIGPYSPDYPLITSVNYFGAKAVSEGVKDLLKIKKGSAVIVTSNSSVMPNINKNIVKVMLEENDEEKTRELAASLDGFNAYTGSKLALTRWVRRSAPAWAKDGIRLNAVAPGMTKTAMLEEALNSELFGKLLRNLEMPIGRYAEPEEVAECILFLLSKKASACCGAVLFADGGTDVTFRPDSY
jgi:NAD(P)-dependent dehydrogenase (short-subunit alcohol dehydrogenase family)